MKVRFSASTGAKGLLVRIFVVVLLSMVTGPARARAQDPEGASSFALRVMAINGSPADQELVGRLHGQLSEFTSHIRLVRPSKVPVSLRAQLLRARQELRQEPAAAIVWLHLRRSEGRSPSENVRARLAILLAEQEQGQGERLLVSDLSQRASRSSLLEEAAIITRETILAWKRMERVGDDPETTVKRIELEDSSGASTPEVPSADPTPATIAPSPIGPVEAGASTALTLGVGASHGVDGQSRHGSGGLNFEVGVQSLPFRMSLQGTFGLWGRFSDNYTEIEVRSHRLALRGATRFAQVTAFDLEIGAMLGVCADELAPTPKSERVINIADAALLTFCAGAEVSTYLALTPDLGLRLSLGLTAQAETLQTQYKATFDAPHHSLWALRPYGTIQLSYALEIL